MLSFKIRVRNKHIVNTNREPSSLVNAPVNLEDATNAIIQVLTRQGINKISKR